MHIQDMKPNEDREAVSVNAFSSVVKAIITHLQDRIFCSYEWLYLQSNFTNLGNAYEVSTIVKTLAGNCNVISTMQNKEVDCLGRNIPNRVKLWIS